MPSGDYAAIGGGALKLKGAKIQKTKKKKRKDKSDLEKNLSGGEISDVVKTKTETNPADAQDAHPSQRNSNNDDDEEEAPELRKTEAERRYEEVKRKRLQKLAESSTSRPELLKTHKERVEELNTYLSKLSEHHDMPKIGPG
ncbi:hypothetical protein E4U43_007960 [Claviceps pusilla]|uniref:DUF1754-domain-containing protein n=1 Tax=Claviceps pusilla TaxID=123648 RepID=A0A9P7T149_9HYPO|nr:hypothetical protein E4U43_007960 [Claviceps pusilla]